MRQASAGKPAAGIRMALLAGLLDIGLIDRGDRIIWGAHTVYAVAIVTNYRVSCTITALHIKQDDCLAMEIIHIGIKNIRRKPVF